jgi:short-chain Z-isoprenyl diphosphate synthase
LKSASVFEWAFHAGIEYLTIWIFSDDNFKRSREEVDGLMRIFEEECEDKLYDGVLYTYQVRYRRHKGC